MILNKKLILLIVSILTGNYILSIPVTQKGIQETKSPIISSQDFESEKIEEKENKSKSDYESKIVPQMPIITFNPLGRIFLPDSDGIKFEVFVFRNPMDSTIWVSNGSKTNLEKWEAKTAKELVSRTEYIAGLKPLRLKVLGLNAKQLGVNVPKHELKYVILQNLDNFDIWTFNPLARFEEAKEYMKSNPELARAIIRKLKETR